MPEIWSAYKAERGRQRAISDLEALPPAVLKDIGIRRGQIPLAVENAKRHRFDDEL